MSNFAKFVVPCLLFLSCGCFQSQTYGSFVFNVVQSGNDVTTAGIGSLNTGALVFAGTNAASASVDPVLDLLIGGPQQSTPDEVFRGLSGPANLGTGQAPLGVYPATGDGAGNLVGIGSGGTLLVPNNYLSGASLSDADTYSDVTLSYLGFANGTYVYTWGTGPTADSLTINIGTVPEPATAAVLAIPATLALLRRRRVLR